MKVVVAGGFNKDFQQDIYDYNIPKLYSILNEKKPILEYDDSYFLIVDSGAHTWNKNSITKVGHKSKRKLKPAIEFIEYYYQFIKEHRHKKFIFIEFDTYGDLSKEIIDSYYYKIKQMDMTAKFIRVYHPILDNGNLDTIRKWIDEGQDYICIANDSLDLLDGIFNLTQDKIKVHGLAITKLPLMERYPFFSVDSTSPLSTVMFGRYSKPIMNFNERKDIAKIKSIECFHENQERLRNALIETKKTQEYCTNLWIKKGIRWEDIKW